jgi:hypothetical protein
MVETKVSRQQMGHGKRSCRQKHAIGTKYGVDELKPTTKNQATEESGCVSKQHQELLAAARKMNQTVAKHTVRSVHR